MSTVFNSFRDIRIYFPNQYFLRKLWMKGFFEISKGGR